MCQLTDPVAVERGRSLPHGLAKSDIARVHEIIAPYIRQTPIL